MRAAMIEAPTAHKSNIAVLESQAAARRAREKMLKDKNLAKATDEYIEASYLISMYDSDACVKGDPRAVTAMLKKLGSDTARYRFLKTNINIRVRGFGWGWAGHAWSKDGKKYSVNVLVTHLRDVIRKENKGLGKGELEIPTEPKINVPGR